MAATLAAIPAHVPESLVVDFDYQRPPGHEEDVHLAWSRLHAGPDIVWTPYYGGHWIATRADDIDVMQVDHERFSYRRITIPPQQERTARLNPLEYDPPEHTPRRAILSPAFGPKAMQALEGGVRALAVELIEGFAKRGECEFVGEFAKHLPIQIFLRLVDLPVTDREHLLELTELTVRPKSPDDQVRAFQGLYAYVQEWIIERRAHPGGDLFSKIVNAKIDGADMPPDQTFGMLSNVLFGGLDTVASSMGFFAKFLAENPTVQQELKAKPELTAPAIEEILRRFGIPNTAREITRDFEYKGVQFRRGEQVMLSKTLHGLDERRFADPFTVDLRRKRTPHAAFGDGPHRCPGSFLARMEIRVWLEEWLRHIPEFRIQPGARPRTSSGPVNGVLFLPLRWDPAQRPA
jgi:cytochrome P450